MVFIGAILKPRSARSDRVNPSPLIQVKPAPSAGIIFSAVCLLSCPSHRRAEFYRVDPASRRVLYREEAFLIASLLALTGGYLDAYTVFQFIIAIMHIRLPAVTGTLGLSSPAFQTVSFPKVEGWSYSSVMATSNFRFTTKACSPLLPEARPERFAGPACSERCASLSEWGQPSAVMTEVTRAYSFAIPVTLLVMVLSVCE